MLFINNNVVTNNDSTTTKKSLVCKCKDAFSMLFHKGWTWTKIGVKHLNPDFKEAGAVLAIGEAVEKEDIPLPEGEALELVKDAAGLAYRKSWTQAGVAVAASITGLVVGGLFGALLMGAALAYTAVAGVTMVLGYMSTKKSAQDVGVELLNG